ncbi:MAG: sulfatase-like hydrolase/transferase [Hyphomicrobiales bacterium]|nr:sulfatase-like hydrolase/transferase [Hyphomicrobiales bacterium]
MGFGYDARAALQLQDTINDDENDNRPNAHRRVEVTTMKNILFIGVDQMRADVVGPGKAVPSISPNLDGLIAEGVAFTRAYSTCPLCTPARASMFTGDYAFRHGMGTNCDMYHALGTELRSVERLLHTDLLDAGYRCGFVGKWHAGVEKGPGDYGFEGNALPGYGNLAQSDEFKSYLAENGLTYSVEPTLSFNPDGQTVAAGHWHGPVESTMAHYLTNQAIDMLADLGADSRPFFLTVQYWDPHGPHFLPDDYYGLTDRGQIAPWPNFGDDLRSKPGRIRRERDDFYRLHPQTEAELIEYIGLYCDHVALVDTQIGRLLNHLEAAGLFDDTLIVFTSDHGDMTGAHGGLIDKGLLYEEAMRVPLVFSHPALGRGERHGLALNMDVLPTAMSMVGVRHQPRQASDLSDQVRDAEAAGRPYLLGEYHGLRFLYSQRMLVSDDGWKFIFTPGDQDELYNLNDDPGEMADLSRDPDHADRLAGMRQALIEETARFDDPLHATIAKFNGQWQGTQFDATTAYLKP